MKPDAIRARQKTIKRELREIAASPDAPGAVVRAQQLRGEYRRLAGQLEAAARPTGNRPPEPELTEDEKWAAIPGAVGKRIRRSSAESVITSWHTADPGYGP